MNITQQPHMSPDHGCQQTETRWGMVRSGMEVWARDGKIGKLIMILRDRHTNEPSHLVVRRGRLWWQQDLLVPLHWIIDIVGTRANMNLRLEQVAHLRPYRSAEQIRYDVCELLYTTPMFMQHSDFLAITVMVRHNVVYLRGHVRNTQRKMLAQALVHQVQGVHEVQNELVADTDVQRQIQAVVARIDRLGNTDIQAQVRLGSVWLRGTVPTSTLHRQITQTVLDMPGVALVHDEIAVAAAAQPAHLPTNSSPRARPVGGSYSPLRRELSP